MATTETNPEIDAAPEPNAWEEGSSPTSGRTAAGRAADRWQASRS